MEDIYVLKLGEKRKKSENRFREYVYWKNKSYEKYLEKFIFKKGRRIYGRFLILRWFLIKLILNSSMKMYISAFDG